MAKRYRKESQIQQLMAGELAANPKYKWFYSTVPVVLAVLFFIATCYGATESIKTSTLILAILMPVVVLFARSWLRERFSVPTVALTLVILLDLLSVAWAVSGKFALNELLKVIAAFSMTVLLLALVPGDRRRAGRNMAAALSGAMAIASLISIDTLSTQFLSGLFFRWMNGISYAFLNFQAIVAGPRMNSIFLNPNAFAGCAGIAVMLGLGLLISARSRRERLIHSLCLCVNSVAFLLAFSRGAVAVIAVAFLVYLLLERKGHRGRLLLIMVITLLLTGAATALSTASGALNEWTEINWVPLLSALVCGLILGGIVCMLDAVEHRLSRLTLSRRTGIIFVTALGVLIIAAGVFLYTAFQMDEEPLTVSSQGTRRAFYPDAGDYTVTLEADGEMRIRILSQTRREAVTNIYSTLYTEEASSHNGTMQIPITVPEGTIAVYLLVDEVQGNAVISSAVYDGTGGSGHIPLGYSLLPNFIATRLQGALQSYSFLLRLMYFEDGLKLFQKSPVWGLGIGAVENSLPSVQTYSYEVKYVHNHYVQAMAETGLLGLACFLGLIVSSAWLVLRTRRKEDGDPLAAALGGALIFIAGHAAVEIDFSFYAFLPIGYATFALIGLCCGEGITLPGGIKKWQSGTMAVGSLASLVFAVLLGLNLYAYHLVTDNQASLSGLVRAASFDPFENADYKLSYVVSTMEFYGAFPEVSEQADRYAEELAQLDSNSIPPYLMEFYFATGRESQALELAVKYLNYVPSMSDAWNDVFALLIAYESDSDEFKQTVLELDQFRRQWNEEHLSAIALGEEAAALVDRCGGQTAVEG